MSQMERGNTVRLPTDTKRSHRPTGDDTEPVLRLVANCVGAVLKASNDRRTRRSALLEVVTG